MYDTSVSSDTVPENESPQSSQWLVLTHQIPPKPAYFRVKVRRRLDRIGAVLLKNSVYVLPDSEDAREDFQWLRQEIEREGGEATLCVASFVDGSTESRLVRAFRRARSTEYAAVRKAAERLLADWKGGSMDRNRPHDLVEAADKLRRRLAEIEDLDRFSAPGRPEAEAALTSLESAANDDASLADPDASGTEASAERPAGATWVTRTGPKVDRMASAWLIRRFIDPAACLKFVPAQGYVPEPGELRFDMFEGEFTHVGDACTFETLLARFDLREAPLSAVGEIVHDIDCKDEKFLRAEVAGVASLVDGIIRAHAEDEARIERGAALFDDLYEHFRSTRA